MEKYLNPRSLFVRLTILISLSVILTLAFALIANSFIATVQEQLKSYYEVDTGSLEFLERNYTAGTNKEGLTYYVSYRISRPGLYRLLSIIRIALPVLMTAFGIFFASYIFYKNNMKRPIELLRDGISHIENRNLDFKMDYDSNNELGALCRSFDTMRDNLNNAFKELWAEKEKQNLLVRSLAHDLRTPLAVIRGRNELIGMSLEPQIKNSADLAESIEIINKSISQMENHLSNMRKIQSLEETPVKKQLVELKEFVDHISAMRVIGDNILLNIELAENKKVFADPAIVNRVLDNLVTNAFEHAKSKVTVSIRAAKDHLFIRIKDDGDGFSKEALERAPDPFYRSDKTAGSPHSGLGLSITKTLSERHGGDLILGNIGNGAFAEVRFGVCNGETLPD